MYFKFILTEIICCNYITNMYRYYICHLDLIVSDLKRKFVGLANPF